MTGSALMDFLIALVGLCLIVGIIFKALDFIAPDERFKTIARYAVGGVALIAFLVAVKGVLFGGHGGISVTPVGLIEFAIGLIVLMVVLYIIYLVVDFFAPAQFAVQIKYVLGAIALIALLVIAERALFGGGLGMMGGVSRRSELYHPMIDRMVPCAACLAALGIGGSARRA
jgi:hypothetical protein